MEEEILKPIRNYGVDLERQKADESDTDWIAGEVDVSGIADDAAGAVIAIHAFPQPKNGVYPRTTNAINHCVCFWEEKDGKYFPNGEVQSAREDFMDCVSRGFNNEIERQINFLLLNNQLHVNTVGWLQEKGYLNDKGMIELSDRFIAILSNTTRNGNSLKNVIDTGRKVGYIPNKMLAKRDDMTWDMYHKKSDITDEMKQLGQEFLQHIVVNYTTTTANRFGKFISGSRWFIFDSYIDWTDGDYIKQLAPDYIFYPNGYLIHLNENVVEPKATTNNNNDMQFYRRQGDDGYYLKGVGDNLYHRIKDETVFYDLFGSFKANEENTEWAVFPDDQLGSIIGTSISFIQPLLDFFNRIRGSVRGKVLKTVPALGSSVDSTKVSKTFANFATMIIPLVIMGAGWAGVTLDLGDLTTLSESIQNALVAIWAAWTAIQGVIGAIRRFKK